MVDGEIVYQLLIVFSNSISNFASLAGREREKKKKKKKTNDKNKRPKFYFFFAFATLIIKWLQK